MRKEKAFTPLINIIPTEKQIRNRDYIGRPYLYTTMLSSYTFEISWGYLHKNAQEVIHNKKGFRIFFQYLL